MGKLADRQKISTLVTHRGPVILLRDADAAGISRGVLRRMVDDGASLSNVWIPVAGRWYRVDHLVPDAGVIIEADGALKYDNQSRASVLISNDREREEHLRGLGFGIARYTWGIAEHHPTMLLARVARAARMRGSQPPPTCWTLDSPYT